MKHRSALLIAALMILALQASFAKIVSKDQARLVATHFITERILNNQTSWSLASLNLQEVTRVDVKGQPAFYVYSNNGDGFIVISAEDLLTPVLGYSFESAYPEKGTNRNFDSFIQSYAEQVDFIRSQPEITGEFAGQWSRYLNGNTTKSGNAAGDVAPMLLVMWNQDSPYNIMCPADPAGPGGHVYAGCVATAMSMIMYYYRYPEHGYGSHSYNCPGYGTLSVNFANTYYNWDEMQNSVSNGSGQCIPSVATLQYHAGVAVNMGYAADGSGAYSDDVPYALKTYFGYSSTVAYAPRSGYNTTTWETMVIDQLNASKPIYYSGVSADGGHAFVVDGYQVNGSTKSFHFNFGWSGSGNGYFTLANAGGFTSQQALVRNIIPGSTYPAYCSDHTLTGQIGSFEDGSSPRENYLPNSNCTWLITPADSATRITLKFTAFDVDLTDSLVVYDGPDADGLKLGSFSGNSLPADVIANTGKMFLQFFTNSSQESKGFQAEYNASAPVYCSGTQNITEPFGTITDGSGVNHYNNNAVCKFKINLPYAADLTLHFTEFDLESKDELLVYSLANGSSLLATLTGNQIPAAVSAPSGGMLLIFKSDSYDKAGGFSLDYTISNVNVKGNGSFESLEVSPNPASDHIAVRFYSEDASACTLSLNNSNGQGLLSRTADILQGRNEVMLDVSNLPRGIYFLNLKSDKGIATQKLVLK